MLAQEHPDLFAEAIKYEQEHSDGRNYTWTEKETLLELIGRKDEIISDHNEAISRKRNQSSSLSLVDVLENVLAEEDDTLPCLACHL